MLITPLKLVFSNTVAVRLVLLVVVVPNVKLLPLFSQENRRVRLNDSSRVRWAEKCQNWTSTGNDHTGEPDRNSWVAVTVRLRCRPAPDFAAASVNNTDGMLPIERRLYGTSTVVRFLLT